MGEAEVVESSDGLKTRGEIARYLGVPSATLARWAYEGKGPRYYRVGRHTRYRLEDVLIWLETSQSSVGPTT
jgi:excisionase family DNA binding protein